MNLFEIEREALKYSVVHKIEGRIKIVSFLLIVLSAVFIGRNSGFTFTQRITGLGILEIYLLAVLFVAGLDKILFLKRIVFTLPFIGAIVIIKPFIEAGSPIVTLPLGITATYEGTCESVLILSTIIVSISSIIMLSSTTTIQGLVDSMIKMRIPKELALLFGMTLRYLFLYFDVFQKIVDAQKTRCFSLRNKRVRFRFILEQIGFTVMVLFMMSYQQGLNIYQSMLSRGYNTDSALIVNQGKIALKDVSFAALTVLIICRVLLL